MRHHPGIDRFGFDSIMDNYIRPEILKAKSFLNDLSFGSLEEKNPCG
jgi:hypothetical protein